ncbi:PRAME family member 20-like [Ictidomys tridecemlineatus]|uniref:PRAME family member 20-like n=1 Tax=Ictidomys tridecemlineatus TaxID=43179 RepID=UPI000B5478E8|nr:PRAME family member 20-like [Ictidomys tridecemlineatus]KAG3257360.1 PRAME family member 20-like [Ictidomys tridecemlineatus]
MDGIVACSLDHIPGFFFFQTPQEEHPVPTHAAGAGRAFSKGHTEVLKKMVQTWLFTHLPLGALMRKTQLEMILVALDGLDMLLAKQDCLRRWKLQVLDFYNVPQNFWRTWSGAVVDACSPEDIKKNRTLKFGPAMAAKPPFKVVIDLSLRKRPLDEFLTHLFLWVTQRRDKLHLCCNRLKNVGKSTSHTRKVLRLLQLDPVQKVKVHCTWAPFTLAASAPLLGHMRKLFVSQVYVPAYTSQEEQEQLLAQLTLQFLRMDCLRTNLKTPLDSLSITNCPLSDSDWNYLSQYSNTRQLRHLELRSIKLTDFSLEPLQILLDSTATTLNSLDLIACRITDSQLQALLPALSRCSQLVILIFHGNRLSMSTLRDLLLHTARLTQLSVELYPALLEIYDAWGTIHPGRCSQLCAELTAIVRNFRQPNILVFCTVPCHHCGYKILYNQGIIHCSCPTAA